MKRRFGSKPRARPDTRAAGRSRPVRQTPVHGQGGLGTLLVLCAAARARVSPTRRRVLSNRASRSAPRGRVLRTRSRGQAHARPGGHSVSARLPCVGEVGLGGALSRLRCRPRSRLAGGAPPARAAAASKVALAGKRRSMPRAGSAGRSRHFRLPMHVHWCFAGAVPSIYTEAQH